MKFIKITTKKQVDQASKFLSTDNAFEDSKDWNKTEVESLVKTPYRVFDKVNYHAWMMVDSNEVIGYIDLREHDLKNDGYYTDWFVVHKDHRNQGTGGQMLEEVEKFAKSLKARYILIETGDIDFYKRTRNFYEKHGYNKVGHIPEYYYKDWGMCIYQKVISHKL